jgi:glycosyl transferase, family 25
MKLIDLFDCIIILNLPSRSDRRKELRRELVRVGWDPDDPRITWFPAIDTRTAAGYPSAGSRGCFLSHIAALNLARNAGNRRVLILEDDCDFAADFAERQAQFADWLASSQWGIAYLGHAEAVSGHPRLATWHPETRVMLTHCYAVAGDVLLRLPRYLEAITLRARSSPDGGPMSIDAGFSWFRRYNPDVVTVLAVPSLAQQRRSRSDLSPRWFDKVPGLAGTVAIARSIRSSLSSPASKQPLF